MYKPLPSTPAEQLGGTPNDPDDGEISQDQNHSQSFIKAFVRRRKDKKPKGVKPERFRRNENGGTRALNAEEIGTTSAPDEGEVIGAEKVDAKENESIKSLSGVENAPHDPEHTNWKESHEKAVEQLEDLEAKFKNLKTELSNYQWEIHKRALDFSQSYGDHLYSDLPAGFTLEHALEKLLGRYEVLIKDKKNINQRWLTEHNRLREKEDHFLTQQAHLKSSHRAELTQQYELGYSKGAVDEHSRLDLWWNEHLSEHHQKYSEQSQQLLQVQVERRELATKVGDLETKVAIADSERTNAVHKVKQECDQELRTLKQKSEDADLKLARELSILAERHRSQIEEATSQLKTEYELKLKTMEEEHENEDEKRENEHKAEILKIKREKENLRQNHAAELDRLEKRHTREVSELRADIASLKEIHKRELESKESNYSSELSKARDQIEGLEEKHTKELETRRRAHVAELLKLEAQITSHGEKHTMELRTKSTTYATELEARDQIHAEEELKLKKKMESLKLDHTAALKSRDDAHATATSKLKKQFRDHLAQREKEHSDVTKALRVTVGEYSGALLDRDKITYNMIEGKPFEPLLDAEVEARFIGLAEEVDTLSRLDWKAYPSGWPDAVLLKLSRNQKTLKRQILKDTIWVILHEFVFCSPFRVFGDEGRVLESKWNEECGADEEFENGSYTWPTPSFKTERWRYITIRECRAALQKPTPSPYDPLAKPRKDFQTSIKTIKEELTTAVGGLVTLDQANIQDLEKLAMRAARTWLEFGLQRYRVMVQMQGDNIRSVKRKVERLGDGLELVVAPRLERFGNAKGEDLDEQEVIGELAGETETVRLSR